MKDKEIDDFARKNGYAGARYLKKWNGYLCYEPFMDREEMCCIGLPYVILVKCETIRMSTDEEAMKI